MITYRLGVDDLAATRFAISPMQETVCSLWAVAESGACRDPPARGCVRSGPNCETLDTRLLLSIVGPTRALPDFLTPRPVVFSPSIADELAVARSAPADRVRDGPHRDLPARPRAGRVEGGPRPRTTGPCSRCATRSAICWSATGTRAGADVAADAARAGGGRDVSRPPARRRRLPPALRRPAPERPLRRRRPVDRGHDRPPRRRRRRPRAAAGPIAVRDQAGAADESPTSCPGSPIRAAASARCGDRRRAPTTRSSPRCSAGRGRR